MGAMRDPLSPLSLDHRLVQAADIREQINRQLDEIEEAIDDLTNIIHNPNSNRNIAVDPDISSKLASIMGIDAIDNTTEESLDEANIIIQVIHECINSLFRLGMLVRKLSPCDRFKQALRNPDLAFLNFPDIDYVNQKYPKLSNSRLSERFGGAIAKRRQFIKYCRDHRSRLGAEETTHDVTATERLSSKATTFVPDPSFIGDLQEEECDNSSLTSASTMADSSSNLTLPRLADVAPTLEPFECPICFTLQSFQREKSWRIHAFRDLKAYVCTLGGAECDGEFFEDRDSWFEHELQKHRSKYICILCKSRDFSFEDLQTHVLKTHGSLFDTQLKMLQEAGRERHTGFKARDCPFCDEWAETLMQKANPKAETVKPIRDILVNHNRFKRHVATHQEQLAIFALPRVTGDEHTPDSGSIAASGATVTSMASIITVDRDMAQDAGTENEDILPQNPNSPPADTLNDYSTTRRDDILDKERDKSSILPEISSEIDISSLVLNSPGGETRSPSSNVGVGKEQEKQTQDESERLGKPLVGLVHNESHDLRKYDNKQTVLIWQCCACASLDIVNNTTPQCSDINCQHTRCSYCTIESADVSDYL